jgi:hypothetical protein
MIFPNLLVEPILQVADKTRLDASTSYVTPDEGTITLIEIDPDGSSGYIDVTDTGYLDWGYSTAGSKTATVRVTTDVGTNTKSETITVLSSADDKLFSSDQDLKLHVHDILKYVPPGKNSFKHIHRRAQSIILDDLDQQEIWDTEDNRLTKDAILDTQQVKEWSTYLTLRLIYEDLSNAIDDVFIEKAREFKAREAAARKRFIELDLDGDGEADEDEGERVFEGTVVRR